MIAPHSCPRFDFREVFLALAGQFPYGLAVPTRALGSVAGTLVLKAKASQETVTMNPVASRPSAPEVAPVEHQGIRHERDRPDERNGDQPGGYLAAIDPKTEGRLWRVKIYEVARQPEGAPTTGRFFARCVWRRTAEP